MTKMNINLYFIAILFIALTSIYLYSDKDLSNRNAEFIKLSKKKQNIIQLWIIEQEAQQNNTTMISSNIF